MNTAAVHLLPRKPIRLNTALSLLLVLLLGATNAGCAADDGTRMLRSLPDHISHTAGSVTVFADYVQQQPAAREGLTATVPLYIVNRTDQPLTLSQQDRHAYFQAEVQIDGQWQRTTPFAFSWCGNSYHQTVIPPGRFAVFRGLLPEPGDTRAPLRFRRAYDIDTPLISNVSTTTYRPADVARAKFDALAVHLEADAVTLIAIMEGRSPFGDDVEIWGAAAEHAAEALGRRHADPAMAWVKQAESAEAPDYDVLAAVRSGIMTAPETDFDTAFACYLAQLIYPADPEFSGRYTDASALASRFPAEAFEVRDRVAVADPERQRLEVLQLEYGAARHGPASFLEAILRGEVSTIAYPQEEMINFAIHRLPEEFPDAARRFAAEFNASPDAQQRRHAQALHDRAVEVAYEAAHPVEHHFSR